MDVDRVPVPSTFQPVAKIAFVLFVVMAIDPLLVTVPVPPSLTVCVVVSGPVDRETRLGGGLKGNERRAAKGQGAQGQRMQLHGYSPTHSQSESALANP